MSFMHVHHGASESFWISGALVIASLVYLRGWMRLRSDIRGHVAGWRALSFVVGLLFIWMATASPLALLDHEMLTAHMVHHLLLMTLAPPLILLGRPRKPLAHVLTQTLVPRIAKVIRPAPMWRLGRALLHPTIGWIGATAALIVWHIPSLFALGLQSPGWHVIEQASFLVTGLLFWLPVIGPSQNPLKWPESSILLYLFFATLPCDILSGFLVFYDRVVYPVCSSCPQSFGLSALEDQQCAGALMWTCVTVVYLIAGGIFAVRLLSPRWSEHCSTLEFEIEHSSAASARQRIEAV